jgi:tRNA threonylcarbamoyladenosine biosynthesis protein TsaB
MKILALEFSSGRRSVAVAVGGTVRGEAAETGGRESHPFRLIGQALRGAGLPRGEIEVLAVGLGPGSYNGIRSAIAVAQGWQLARPVRLVGLGSLTCLAAHAWAEGLRGPVSGVVDAQRGEFYLAGFGLEADALRETAPLRLAARAEVLARAAAGDLLLSPDDLAGLPGLRRCYPDAVTLARLAQGPTGAVAGEELEPIYLRAPAFLKAPPPRIIPGI